MSGKKIRSSLFLETRDLAGSGSTSPKKKGRDDRAIEKEGGQKGSCAINKEAETLSKGAREGRGTPTSQGKKKRRVVIYSRSSTRAAAGAARRPGRSGGKCPACSRGGGGLAAGFYEVHHGRVDKISEKPA